MYAFRRLECNENDVHPHSRLARFYKMQPRVGEGRLSKWNSVDFAYEEDNTDIPLSLWTI